MKNRALQLCGGSRDFAKSSFGDVAAWIGVGLGERGREDVEVRVLRFIVKERRKGMVTGVGCFCLVCFVFVCFVFNLGETRGWYGAGEGSESAEKLLMPERGGIAGAMTS